MPVGSREPVLIAGGGIGGLAAALALARRGWASIIAERRSEWSEAGAGIQISPNGYRVLERLGVAERLAPFAARPEEVVVREAAAGRLLQRLPLGDWIARRHGAPYWLAHRRDLQAALVAAVEAQPLISVEKGFESLAFEEVSSDRIALRAHDGRRIEGGLLIGADGVFSRVRQQLFAPRAPTFSGWTAARTVIPARAQMQDRDAAIRNDATGVWLAPKAHIVHYPVRAGAEIAIVVVRKQSWSDRGWSEPVEAAGLESEIATIAPAFAAALGNDLAWRRWALFETEPLARWSKGRMTILGDAAHPTLPFMAQGGVLALEDAAVLAACLSAHGDPVAGLAAYEKLRFPRARRVVAAARRNAFVFHLSGPAAFARDAAMRLLGGEKVMAGYDWLYGWQPD